MGSNDEHDGARPRPDPLDRPWLHPSELRPGARRVKPRRDVRPWVLGLGAFAAIGAIAFVISTDPGGGSRVARSADGTRTTTTGVLASINPTSTAVDGTVVKIAAIGSHTRIASGVGIDDEGHVITSRQAILDVPDLEVIDASGTRRHATVLGDDPDVDLAVLHVSGLRTTAPLGSTTDLQTGAAVGTLCAGDDRTPVESTGTVEDPATHVVTGDGSSMPGLIAVATTGDMVPGGALLGEGGRVIGMLVAAESDRPTAGAVYAVPIEVARTITREIVHAGRARRPWLGIEATDATPGVVVRDVTAGGPAATAGLRRDDVIMAADGVSLSGADDLSAAIMRRGPDERVSLVIRRGADRLTVRVVLGIRTVDGT